MEKVKKKQEQQNAKNEKNPHTQNTNKIYNNDWGKQINIAEK